MAFYRKKPVVIEAFRINIDAPPMWLDSFVNGVAGKRLTYKALIA